MPTEFNNTFVSDYEKSSTSDSEAAEVATTPIFQWQQSHNGAPHSAQTQPQGIHPVDIAIRRFMSDQSYQEPRVLNTPSHCWFCFFFAVQRVLASRGLGIPPLALMFKIYKRIARDAPEFEMDNNNNFRVDQGAMVLHEVGQRLGLGNVQLGTWRPSDPGILRGTDPNVVLYDFPGAEKASADYTVWLRHTGHPDGGHFDGLVPAGSWVWQLGDNDHPFLKEEQSETTAERIVDFDKTMAKDQSSIVDVPDDVLLKFIHSRRPIGPNIQEAQSLGKTPRTSGSRTSSSDRMTINSILQTESRDDTDSSHVASDLGYANADNAYIKEKEC